MNNTPPKGANAPAKSHPLPAQIGRECGAINNIQMFAQTGCIGGFTHTLAEGRVCYYAEAELIGARGVKLWMQASPMGGEQMPSDAAYKVFNDTRRLIEAAPDLLASAKRMSQAFAEHAANHPALGLAVEQLRAAIAKAEGRAPL
ncbi:MAG: hypothetical protein K0S46_2221 [Moraxellaceae bacterium]|jgi:hypothetical protein|nr:hypothetical protein [Moraxellaceae bacterium]